MIVKRLLLTGLGVLCLSLLLPLTAHAQWSTDFNNVSTDVKQEFYYWDGNDIVSAGGRYNAGPDGIRWHPRNDKKYTVDGDWIPVRPGTVDPDNPGNCVALPATGRADGGIEIRTDGSGGLVLDVIGDGGGSSDEDGKLEWGGGLINRECNYHLYDGFKKYIDPYNQDYIVKGIPYAGHLLGKKGMPFQEWTARSDRMNIYNAYKTAAGNDIISHCTGQADVPGCVNSLTASFERCYAHGIGAAVDHVDDKNIDSPQWKADLDVGVFKDCMKNDKSTDPYFTGDKNDFVDRLVEDATALIPPSIAPKVPEKVDPNTTPTEKTHCAIAKIGWIMCPALNFFANLNDRIYNILQNWLYVNPFYANAGTSKTDMSYTVWMQMRDVANLLFVVAFMVIIYSYLTNQGISQYTIRKMTPRLIITAVLVNVSFYICALGVDLSNVAGDSVYKVIHSLTGEINSGVDKFKSWEWVTTSVVMAGGAAAATVVTIANLAALVPLLITALFALVVTFVVLLMRQALIILLVVISPLAFAMFLLPNTRKWFDRWRSTFVSLLLLYPAIALVFAGSYFASRVVASTASDNGDVMLAIFSLGIQVIPLFISPLLIKLSGGVLNRFAGMVNNPNKGPFDRLKKRANQFRDDRKVLQQTRSMNGAKGTFGMYGALQRREARRKYKLQYHQSARDREQAKMIGQEENAESIANMVAGRTSGNTELQQAIQNKLQEEARQLREEDTRVAGVLIENQLFTNQSSGLLQDIYRRAAEGVDSNGDPISEAERAAAIQKVVQNGDIDEIHHLVDNVNTMNSHQRDVLADSIQHSGVSKAAAHLGTTDGLQSIREGRASVNQMYATAARQGVYTPATMAMQDSKSLARMGQAYSSGALNDQQMQAIQTQFATANSPDNHKYNQFITQASRDQMAHIAQQQQQHGRQQGGAS